MKKYEIMYIVRPTLSDEERATVVQKFNEVLTADKKTEVKVEELGQRELAYEIKKFRSGYYYVLEVENASEDAIKEFDRLALISTDIIRHLKTKKEVTNE